MLHSCTQISEFHFPDKLYSGIANGRVLIKECSLLLCKCRQINATYLRRFVWVFLFFLHRISEICVQKLPTEHATICVIPEYIGNATHAYASYIHIFDRPQSYTSYSHMSYTVIYMLAAIICCIYVVIYMHLV